MSKFTIQRSNLVSAGADKLIKALNEELIELYPEDGANHFRLDPEEVEEGRGAFFIAFSNRDPIGCGAVRLIDASTAEIKRMYVIPPARGIGLGHKILKTLTAEAVRLGAGRIVLETGERQAEALALYIRAGFNRIPAFGEYITSPLSLCMEKNL